MTRSRKSTKSPPPGFEVGQASWIEISAKALKRNVSVFRGLLAGKAEAHDGAGSSKNIAPALGAVLKSNAYGHGMEEALSILHPIVDVLLVTTAREAFAIRRQESKRELSRRRLIVMGAVDSKEIENLARLGVEAVLSGDYVSSHIDVLKRVGLRLRVHVHVDTGLGREGYALEDMATVAEMFEKNSDTMELVGICSHFANVEDVTEQDYARKQLQMFDQAAAKLEALSRAAIERHMAASAAAIVLPSARLDVVRAGISIYGLWPSAETRLSARVLNDDLPRLSPSLSWRCRPQLIKQIESGSYVGYGCTWRASRPTRIAVLPVGYFDGYPRIVSGRAHVLVGGMRCPIIGRVMMNHMVADVTGVPDCDYESLVTLIGTDGKEQVAAETLASWAQTINYEIVARLGSHLDRFIIDG